MKTTERFDAAAGNRAKEAAIAAVDAGAPDEWKARAREALLKTCQRLATFTSDDVWEALAVMGVEPSDAEPRAIGAIMQRGLALGICEKATDLSHRLSVRKLCHRRPLQVWRSLVLIDPTTPIA